MQFRMIVESETLIITLNRQTLDEIALCHGFNI